MNGGGAGAAESTPPVVYEFEAEIKKSPGLDAAYIELPFDIKKEWGKGRAKVHASFDGEPYDGSAVNMGVKNKDGSICYIIGLPKALRQKIQKQCGDTVKVTIRQAGHPAGFHTCGFDRECAVPRSLARQGVT
jgi:hypothetical protein